MVGRIRKLYFVSGIWVKDEDGRERHRLGLGCSQYLHLEWLLLHIPMVCLKRRKRAGREAFC